MLFIVDPNHKTAELVEAQTFADLKFGERFDLQEWVLANPELLGEDLLVVTSEFDKFDRTSERLDALMLDRQGKLVVVELKRSAVGTAADLQALRYAAYCSTLAFDDVVDLYARFRERRGEREFSSEQALTEIREFIVDPAFEDLDNRPRIILGAGDFPHEMTATLLWLRTFELDISAVRLRPHIIGERVVLESSVLIPLPEAEDYLIRRERKDVEQSSRARGKMEQYRVFFQQLIDTLREVHHFTDARVGQPQNWYSFASGFSGITFGAVFSLQGLRAELYIGRSEREENKRIFDRLHAEAENLQAHFEEPLSWERLDEGKASRIGVYSDVMIDSAPEELEAAQRWVTERILKLAEVFGPRLKVMVA